MGATRKQRNAEIEELKNTERLFKWINQMRTKKIKYLRNRQRNIRVEAVLGHALSQAEQELRNKQIARIHRWQENNKQMKVTNNSSATSNCKEMDHRESCNNSNNNNNDNNNNNSNVWDGNLCPELDSLDNFMSKLGAIKSPLKR